MRLIPAFAFLATVLWSFPLAAQVPPPRAVDPQAIEGDYEGRGEGAISMRTLVLDSGRGIVAASVGIGARGCAGNFTGIGELKGDTLRLRPFSKEPDGAACVITVTFDRSGKTAAMDESSCLYYHGAACAFSGKLVKKR